MVLICDSAVYSRPVFFKRLTRRTGQNNKIHHVFLANFALLSHYFVLAQTRPSGGGGGMLDGLSHHYLTTIFYYKVFKL